MNDQYSQSFKSIVPDAPSSTRWAEGARRKRRNRGAVMSGVAGVAALALAIPFALSLQTSPTLVTPPGESEAPVPGPEPDPATDAPGAAACWEGPGQPRMATDEGVTEGAVRAWLCGDAGIPEMFPGDVGPLEPLVQGVTDLVEFIRENEVLRDDAECTADAGPDYRIVLDYDDGNRRVASGGLYGCGVIDDGDRKLTGSPELYGRALELWTKQRNTVVAPDLTSTFQCEPPSRSVVPDLPPALRPMLPLSPEEAVSGFTCFEDPEAEDHRGGAATLEAAVVAVVASSVSKDSREGLGEGHLPTHVTLTGAWGEALTLQRLPGDVFQWFDGDGVAMLWKPSSEVFSELAPALEFR